MSIIKGFNNISVTARLHAVALVIFSLVVLLVGLNWTTFDNVNKTHNLAINLQIGARHLENILRGINESIITQGSKASVTMTRDSINTFDALYDDLKRLAADDQDIQVHLSGGWHQEWLELKPRINSLLETSKDIDLQNVTQMIAIGKVIADAGRLAAQMTDLAEHERVEANLSEQEALQRMVIWLVIVMVIIATSFARLTRSVSKPLRGMEKFIINMEHESDLTKRIPIERIDEFGHIATAMNSMLDKFQKILGNVSAAVNSLKEESQHLARVAITTSKGAVEQQRATAELAGAMLEFGKSIEHISSNVNKSANDADEAKLKSKHSMSMVNNAATAINDLAETIKQSSQVIVDLKGKASDIGKVLEVIGGVASQTNLLALNAAIEAARAGEHGRGFAVVADEVRTLATRTQASTEEIHEIISQLQADALAAVKAMEQGQTGVAASVGNTKLAVSSIVAINEAVAMMAELGGQIAVATEEQNAVTEDINRNVVHINDIASQNATDAHTTAEASSNIATIVHFLESTVNTFKVGKG